MLPEKAAAIIKERHLFGFREALASGETANGGIDRLTPRPDLGFSGGLTHA